MIKTSLRAGACSFALSAAVLAAPQSAQAAAFQLREDSAVGLGTSFAGSASAANAPSTVFDNPAGMTQLPGLQIQLGGSIIVPNYTFSGSAVNAFGRPISGVDGQNGGNAGLVPHGFVTYKATPELSLGLAITAPFGLATTYGSNFVGRYQADKTDLRTININPAIAYQVTPWLSIGAGFSAQYARGVFSSFINSSTIATTTFGRPTSLPDGYFHLKGDNWAFGYNAGVLIQPGPQTNIGVSYRSRVQQDLSGTADYIMPAPLNLSARFAASGGNAKIVLPDTAIASITQGFGPNWTGYAEVTWTNWSQFKTLNAYRDSGVLISSTPEHYHNSFSAALGAAYKVNEALTLRAGTAYDQTPVSNVYRTARVPDQSRYWLSIGASYKVLASTTLDFAYAHIFLPNSKIRETSATNDVLTGSYSNSIDIISMGVRMAF